MKSNKGNKSDIVFDVFIFSSFVDIISVTSYEITNVRKGFSSVRLFARKQRRLSRYSRNLTSETAVKTELCLSL